MEGFEDQDDYIPEKKVCPQQFAILDRSKLKELLHRSICAIVSLDGNQQRNAGSGTLISQDIILTAAHNIYDKDLQCENTHFKIYIGAHGQTEDYHQIQTWRYPEQFKNCLKSEKGKFDYALMKLKKPIKFEKYLSFSSMCQPCIFQLNQKLLHIYGFPCDIFNNFVVVNEERNRIILYQCGFSHINRIHSINYDHCKMLYRINTLGGQSGCPVVVDDSIIAVHVGSDKHQPANYGRIIDPILIQRIQQWRKQLGASITGLEGKYCPHLRQNITNLNYSMQCRTTLDVIGYASLLDLSLSYNNLEQVDFRHCPLLARLNLSFNQLYSANLNSNTFLQRLNLWGNKLPRIDLRHNINLLQVYLSKNRLEKIDLSFNTKLSQIYISKNKLENIDLRSNRNLKVLCVQQNSIKEIDLSKNKQMTYLDLQENQLAIIRLSVCWNVTVETYTSWFHLSNQQSSECRVNLMCEGQSAYSQATKIKQAWKKKYNLVPWKTLIQKNSLNRYKCEYLFWAV